MFQSAFTLAFFCLLRVSEFAVSSKSAPADKVLWLSDISLDGIQKQTKGEMELSTELIGGDSRVCPAKALERYLAVCKKGEGPLFVHMDKSPLTRCQVTRI